MIVVHTSIPIKPDYREEAVETTEELARRSREEDGIVSYRAMVDIIAPSTIRFFEQYENRTAVEAHTQTDHYREWIERLPVMVSGRVETLQFDLDGPPETIEFDIEEAI